MAKVYCWRNAPTGLIFKNFTFCHNAKIKVKVTFNIELATKAQRGSRGIVLHFL
jgi:hypothetical protein